MLSFDYIRSANMQYDDNNVFAKILRKEIPAEVVFETENTLVFKDMQPIAATHILAIPKKPYVSFDDFAKNAENDEFAVFFKDVAKAAEKIGVSEGGYRIISNSGMNAQQSVPHFHVHILGSEKLKGMN